MDDGTGLPYRLGGPERGWRKKPSLVQWASQHRNDLETRRYYSSDCQSHLLVALFRRFHSLLWSLLISVLFPSIA